MTTFLIHAAKQKLKLLSTTPNNNTPNNNTTNNDHNHDTAINTTTTTTTTTTTINDINDINDINNRLYHDDTLVTTPRSPDPMTPVPKLNLTTAVEQRER